MTNLIVCVIIGTVVGYAIGQVLCYIIWGND